jgi:hypothetical protein
VHRAVREGQRAGAGCAFTCLEYKVEHAQVTTARMRSTCRRWRRS